MISPEKLAIALTEAGVYVMGADDGEITTDGWDRIITIYASMFHDGVGMIEFGRSGALPAVIAVTKAMSEMGGYFCPPYFPTWFHETWMNEIAMMTGRLLMANDLTHHEYAGRKTQNLKDVGYWAKLFDETRHIREEISVSISQRIEPPYRLYQLVQMLPQLRGFFEHRNSPLRDPARAEQIEQHFGLNDADDERHARLKIKARELLKTEKAA